MASSIDDTLPAESLSKTLEPRRATPDSAGQRAMSDLARVSELPGPALGAALVIEEVLGEGGMGVVHPATQVALGRKVAVKTLRPDQRDAGQRDAPASRGVGHRPRRAPERRAGLRRRASTPTASRSSC